MHIWGVLDDDETIMVNTTELLSNSNEMTALTNVALWASETTLMKGKHSLVLRI